MHIIIDITKINPKNNKKIPNHFIFPNFNLTVDFRTEK